LTVQAVVCDLTSIIRLTETYNSKYPDGSKSYGGYADFSRVPGHFVIPIPDGISSSLAASMMCAGVTMYSPLKQYGAGTQRKNVGIVGIGGLGHFVSGATSRDRSMLLTPQCRDSCLLRPWVPTSLRSPTPTPRRLMPRRWVLPSSSPPTATTLPSRRTPVPSILSLSPRMMLACRSTRTFPFSSSTVTSSS
jgi:hypothetical protein